MKPPRGLSGEETIAWARVAETVTPYPGKVAPAAVKPADPRPSAPTPAKRDRAPPAPVSSKAPAPAAKAEQRQHLDGTWDRKLIRGTVEPDFTLDLHGHTLDSAHARLDAGLAQAKAMGARVVLLIAGKPRPAAAADRASSRGAIRSKVLDWLAAGPHGSDIAAVRAAHRRHGGEGALYLVLRRPRALP